MEKFCAPMNGSALKMGRSFGSPFEGWFLDFPLVQQKARAWRDPGQLFPLDFIEFDDRFEVRINVPGISIEQIALERTGAELRDLSISITPTAVSNEEGTVLHSERASGGEVVKRVVRLSERAGDETEAHLKDGILTVKVLKNKEQLPRKIAITTAT